MRKKNKFTHTMRSPIEERKGGRGDPFGMGGDKKNSFDISKVAKEGSR